MCDFSVPELDCVLFEVPFGPDPCWAKEDSPAELCVGILVLSSSKISANVNFRGSLIVGGVFMPGLSRISML